MTKTAIFSLAAVLFLAVGASAQTAPLRGDYVEFRTADIYTGPCFANSEVGLAGQEAVLAWHIGSGAWDHVALDGLSVLAVVRASATLGDTYANPLPARAVFIVDARASAEQRMALISFAQAQTAGLLANVVAIESAPIRFALGPQHGQAAVEAGDLVKISTRAIAAGDEICHNEEVFYQPLAAHLGHAMPAITLQGSYRGNHLGMTWNDAGRRGAFVGQFAL